jgi:hypothetical protein
MTSVLTRRHRQEIIMNRIRHLTYALAGVAALILSVGTVPAFAERVPRLAPGTTRSR